MQFETKRIGAAPDAIAPDGSEVRVLCQLPRGGLAVFSLASKAVAHRTIEEVWYFTAGCGRMWRKLGDHDDIVPHEAVAKLVQKLSNQRDIKIDYKLLKGATHFFNEHLGGLRDVVDEYLERVLPAASTGNAKAAAR